MDDTNLPVTEVAEVVSANIDAADPTANIADVEAVLADIAKSLVPPAVVAPVEQPAVAVEPAVDAPVEQPAVAPAEPAVDFAKSFATIEAMLVALDSKLSAVEALAKNLGSNAPVAMAKALTVEAALSPMDAAPAAKIITKSAVLNAATAELAKCDNIARKVEIRRAISRLESGFSPTEIAADLRITL